jgi:hypothetical protein
LRERAICDIGYLRVRAITRQPGCDLHKWKSFLDATLDKRRLWKRKVEDMDAPARSTPVQGAPAVASFKMRANANTTSHALQYRYCCSFTGAPSPATFSFSPGLNSILHSKKYRQTRTISLSQLSLRKPNTHQSNALSLLLDPKLFKHMLMFLQYQVFQDLQGPASSLRVGSSVRTSTRPLSVSLLRLCLRYLMCIQRR